MSPVRVTFIIISQYIQPYFHAAFCLEKRALRWLSKDKGPMTEQLGDNCLIKEANG